MEEKYLSTSSIFRNVTPTIIRQKGESQNGCFKKNKARQIFRKTNISYPLIRTHTWESGVLCFLVTPILRFALLPYYRRYDLSYLFTTYCTLQTKIQFSWWPQNWNWQPIKFIGDRGLLTKVSSSYRYRYNDLFI